MTRNREKTILASKFNVVLTPHTKEKYINLFSSAFELKRSVKYYGSEQLLFAEINTGKLNEDIISGYFFLYTDFSIDSSWLNLEKRNYASTDELKRISIPDDLRPNAKKFNFVFLIRKHTLVIEVRNQSGNLLNANFVERSLENLFRLSKENDDTVDVTTYKEKSKIKEIFSWKRLKSISVYIKIPNPDTPTSEYDIEQDFRSRNQHTLKLEAKALPKRSLNLNGLFRSYLLASERNGYATADGESEDGMSKSISTQSKPAKYRVPISNYDDTTEDLRRFFDD